MHLLFVLVRDNHEVRGLITQIAPQDVQRSLFFPQSVAELPAIIRISRNVARGGIVQPLHLFAAMVGSQCMARRFLIAYNIDLQALSRSISARLGGRIPIENRPAGTMHGARETPETPLAKFTRDITQLAREGRLSKVVGRDDEVARVTSILKKKGKNNPVLIGEAGVGKTAIVEALAQRIIDGTADAFLLGKRVLALDLSSIVAGTEFRGAFETRMQELLQEMEAATDCIVFIDELHMIVGAGGNEGGMDVANIIKPALARGTLRCIGATTLDEYRKIEKDTALERRFQPVRVDAPDSSETLEILEGCKAAFETHHHVVYTEEALKAAVALSDRYIHERNQPDKAIDLIDEAGATAVRGEGQVEITEGDIARVVKSWTGIPVEETETIDLGLIRAGLLARIIGQDAAVNRVVDALGTIREGTRPKGGFLFLGPTGVGKTELAKVLAKVLFGTDEALIRLDMSEFQEKFSATRLVGSPPGYVGYDEAGQLTEAVRRKPYSVVLLDEIEKAHPDVYNYLLQILEDGRLTDGQGRTVNFTNTVVIMTSNIITPASSPAIGFDQKQIETEQQKIVRGLKAAGFRSEFINRVDPILFHDLKSEHLEAILDILISDACALIAKRKRTLRVDASARAFLLGKGYNPAFGARPLRRAVEDYILTALGSKLASFPEDSSIVARMVDDAIIFERDGD
jgi:ATP-dependent Clp protease ATP-binding subunit ClpC